MKKILTETTAAPADECWVAHEFVNGNPAEFWELCSEFVTGSPEPGQLCSAAGGTDARIWDTD